jgi:hypothetical protein
MKIPLKESQIIPIYEVIENELDENCVIGRQYPQIGIHHDCFVFPNFEQFTQFYMYDHEVKLAFYLRIKKVKHETNNGITNS